MPQLSEATSAIPTMASPNAERRRSLIAASGAHAIHDGLTDVIYVLLPIWQAQFGISFALVGLLRGVYSGTMATCQLLVSRLAKRWGRKRMLVVGTALAGLAYLMAGFAGGIGALLIALLIGGLGASTQHPLASSLIADAYEEGRPVKEALSQYNFAGDIGKTLVPAAVGLSLTVLSWQVNAWLLGLFAIAMAGVMWWLIPAQNMQAFASKQNVESASRGGKAGGLRALLATGTLDSAARMGFLTFLPFLLQGKGAGSAGIGIALSLLFVGGAFGKLACGYLGARIGMMKTVWITEFSTAFLIVLVLWLPFKGMMVVLPFLGLALNGTSSVLYGAVPELAGSEKRDHAFALFYTATIGAGALAPVLFGHLGDLRGISTAVMTLAALLLLTLPLAWMVEKAMDK